MKRLDTLLSASSSLQAEVGVTEFSAVPAYNPFYTITVTRTLFDGWALVREWGRIGQPGTVREAWFEIEAAASEAGARVRQRKERRGYRALATTRNTNNNPAQ